MRTRITRPLLTADQEIELARRVHGSDAADSLQARNELVLHNLGLAGRIVNRVMRRRPGRDYDDLFSEATLALMQAAVRYAPDTRGTRFSTYAIPAIYNRLRAYTDAETLVRIPNYIQDPVKTAKLLERKNNQIRYSLQDAETARRPVVSLSSPARLAEKDYCPVDPRPNPLDALVMHEDFTAMLESFKNLDPIKAYCHVITRIMSNNELDLL